MPRKPRGQGFPLPGTSPESLYREDYQRGFEKLVRASVPIGHDYGLVIWVSDTEGDDTNAGTSPGAPKKTIVSGLAAIAAAPVGVSNPGILKILDSAIYEEDFTVEDYTHVEAHHATIDGALTLKDFCSIRINRHINNAGNLAQKSSTGGPAYYQANTVDMDGGNGYVTTAAGAKMVVDIGHFYCNQIAGTCFGRAATQTGDLWVRVGEIETSGTALIIFENATGNLVVQANQIAGAAADAFKTASTGDIHLLVGRMDITMGNALNVGAGTTAWGWISERVAGTRVGAGTNRVLEPATYFAHGSDHERGGTLEINGDHLDIDLTPDNYTPVTDPAEAAHVDDLAAHLAGIDDELETRIGEWRIGGSSLTLSGSYQDINLGVEISNTDGAGHFVYTFGNPEIVIKKAGRYLVQATIHFEKTVSAAWVSAAGILSVDTGAGFANITQSETEVSFRNTGLLQACMMTHYIDAAADDEVKMRAKLVSGTNAVAKAARCVLRISRQNC